MTRRTAGSLSGIAERVPSNWGWSTRKGYRHAHERFSVKTRDDVHLAGVHFKSGQDTVFIYCHGFMSGKDYSSVPRFVELLSEDVDVIAFDFRGHGQSTGGCTLGETELYDLDAIVEYAGHFGYGRVVLIGSSMGGAVAIRYAAGSDQVDGVATIGAYAYGKFGPLASRAIDCFHLPLTKQLVRFARRTRVDSVAPRSDPINAVARISPKPILIIHGQFDPLIPLSHARALYARACEPKRLIVIPRGSHDLQNLNRRTKGWILDWMNENVRGNDV